MCSSTLLASLHNYVHVHFFYFTRRERVGSVVARKAKDLMARGFDLSLNVHVYKFNSQFHFTLPIDHS